MFLGVPYIGIPWNTYVNIDGSGSAKLVNPQIRSDIALAESRKAVQRLLQQIPIKPYKTHNTQMRVLWEFNCWVYQRLTHNWSKKTPPYLHARDLYIPNFHWLCGHVCRSCPIGWLFSIFSHVDDSCSSFAREIWRNLGFFSSFDPQFWHIPWLVVAAWLPSGHQLHGLLEHSQLCLITGGYPLVMSK